MIEGGICSKGCHVVVDHCLVKGARLSPLWHARREGFRRPGGTVTFVLRQENCVLSDSWEIRECQGGHCGSRQTR